jgi:CspA family cold shock protein
MAEIVGEAGRERATTLMSTGKVKWFNDQKGFGFIAPDDGSEQLFFHSSSIMGGGNTVMVENEAVAYDKQQCDRGFRAANVEKLSGKRPSPRNVSSRDEIKEALDALARGEHPSTEAPKTEAHDTSHKAKAILSIFLFGTLMSIGLGFITPVLCGICFTFTVSAMWFQWKKKS